MGTDESRIKIRSLIWGMCIKKNPPLIWLTINPADTQDPVALVLCGENINLDNFCALDHRPADVMISSDPYASASFFHLIINDLLDSLFGIQGFKHNNTIERQTGILGDVAAYIGTVEAQGRGTLHLHMLIWLVGSGTVREMKDRLLTEDFRTKVHSFISTKFVPTSPTSLAQMYYPFPNSPQWHSHGRSILACQTMKQDKRKQRNGSQELYRYINVVNHV